MSVTSSIIDDSISPPDPATREQDIRASVIWNACDVFKAATAGQSHNPKEVVDGVLVIANAFAKFIKEGPASE